MTDRYTDLKVESTITLSLNKFTVGFLSTEIAKKVFVTFDNVFQSYLMSGLKKYAKIFFFTVAFFLNPLYPF